MEAITIKNLVKKYKDLTAVDNISLSIEEGEFFGLLGPNGAGKTTTIQVLTGLANRTSGTVKLFGKDVVKDYRLARSYIGLVPQEFNMDIFEKVHNVLYWSAGYFGIPKNERHSKIKKVLEELALWEKKDAKVMELSGGMKRKLMIARALIHEPKILILDEPTAGVDIETRKSMWNYLKKLNSEGITILLTTHYLEEAEELCERIGIINKGKIIKLDSKKNLLKVLDKERVTVNINKRESLNEFVKKYKADVSEDGLSFSFFISHSEWKNLISDLQKLPVESIQTQQNKLEDIFLELTK